MATKNEQSVMGYDPLSWMHEPDSAPSQEAVTEKRNSSVIESQESAMLETSEQHEPLLHRAKIVLDANQTIQNVSQLHEKLLQVLESSSNTIEIDASEIQLIDTASLQCLVILKHEVTKLKKELIFDFPSEKFLEAVKLLGLANFLEVENAASGFF